MLNQTINQIICFIVGMGVGYLLHIIVTILRETKEEVDEILVREKERDDSGILQYRLAFNVVFGTMIVFVFYAAYASFQNGRDLQENQQQDFVRVCVAAENIRDVQRSTVDEVYNLATGVVNTGEDVKRTPAQVIATNLFIDRANNFRESSYRDIRPTKECEPYVHDINVKPRTPPFPHVK